jgi:Tfp pilus assembly protein PilV
MGPKRILQTGVRAGRKRQRGVTFIEVLVAALILVSCLAAVCSTLVFMFSMSTQTVDKAVAYNLGRRQVEIVKETGFYNTAEALSSAPQIDYYDGNFTLMNTNPNVARYKVVTTVTSDIIISASNPIRPADTALRDVRVKVYINGTPNIAYQTATYLSRSGI